MGCQQMVLSPKFPEDTVASSRIGAALVVEPSLTLIIGKFGYLG